MSLSYKADGLEKANIVVVIGASGGMPISWDNVRWRFD